MSSASVVLVSHCESDGAVPPPPPPKAKPAVAAPTAPAMPTTQSGWVDWSTRSWDSVAPVSKSNSAAWTWNCNASGSQSAWQSGSWHGPDDTDDTQGGKRRKTCPHRSLETDDNGAASSSGPRRTSLLSQEKGLNEELRHACDTTINASDFKLPENRIWQPPAYGSLLWLTELPLRSMLWTVGKSATTTRPASSTTDRD